MVVWFWYFLQFLIGYQLIFPMLLFVCFKFVKKSKLFESHLKFYDYAVVVTAYQQTALLPAVVTSLLKLNYTNYLIYVVADNCDISDLNFDDERVVLLRPTETLGNNVKSHFYAINNFKKPHDIITIIDSDNLVEPDYLHQLNLYFNNGFEAVQGVRKAKKISTPIAALDAARDFYYHFYDGEVLFRLGSSATLAGSGMAFTVNLYKQCLSNVKLEGAGFDKVLQAKLLLLGKQIAFAENVIVYDEKTANSAQLINQRARWINTWFKYFKFGFKIFWRGFSGFDKNQLLFGIVLLRPPLFMFLLFAFFFFVINIFINPLLAVFWFTGMCLFGLGFYIALVHGKADKKIYHSLVNIPKFIFLQLASLIHVRNANKKSVATTHVISPENKSN